MTAQFFKGVARCSLSLTLSLCVCLSLTHSLDLPGRSLDKRALRKQTNVKRDVSRISVLFK